MAQKNKSLVEFSGVNRTLYGKCWICSLPEREEIDRAFTDGKTSKPKIHQWLVAIKGYPESEARIGRVRSHFELHHHLKGGN